MTTGPATITDVNVTLNGFSNSRSNDVDMLLVGPTGASTILMSDADGLFAATNLNLTVDDEGADGPMPTGSNSFVDGGSYQPTHHATVSTCGNFGAFSDAGDPFVAPAPAGPYTASLATFDGTNANGDWKLYIVDDCGQTGAAGGGSLTQWCLVFNGSGTSTCGGPTAVTLRSFTATRKVGDVQLVWRTGQESAVAGFNVFRVRGAASTKVNPALVAARSLGSARGGLYRLVDRTARAGATYRLQIVYANGARAWAGTARAR